MFPKRSSELAVFFILCPFPFPYFVIGKFCYLSIRNFFEAAVRSSLDNIWPRGFEERVHVVCTPKFMGNGKISRVQFADVTGWSRDLRL